MKKIREIRRLEADVTRFYKGSRKGHGQALSRKGLQGVQLEWNDL